ncbi:hypothetical protein NUACC26_086440 [Scytonema sp. NUACC26]
MWIFSADGKDQYKDTNRKAMEKVKKVVEGSGYKVYIRYESDCADIDYGEDARTWDSDTISCR